MPNANSGNSEPGDFSLADLLTVDQIVERYPVLKRGELLSAMRSKRLRHWPKGRQRFTTERWVREWIMTQVQGGDAGREVTTSDLGDRRGWDGPGVVRMSPQEEEIVAGLLAQSISRKPRKMPKRAR